MCFPGNARKPQIWSVSLSQSDAKRWKITRPWPKSNQFWSWSAYISMLNFRLSPPCVLRLMPRNLFGRTDGQTDGRTCRKTVTVGQMDQRTHVQVARGFFGLRTDGRTDNPKTQCLRRLKVEAQMCVLKNVTIISRPKWQTMILISHQRDLITAHLEKYEHARNGLCLRRYHSGLR